MIIPQWGNWVNTEPESEFGLRVRPSVRGCSRNENGRLTDIPYWGIFRQWIEGVAFGPLVVQSATDEQ
jgi:hypothetical protein